MSRYGPPGSVRLPRSVTTLAKQRGRSEPLVRIPAWISSGCWPQQQEGTLQHGGKTQDTLSEHTATLRTKIFSCHYDGLLFSFWISLSWPCVCMKLKLPVKHRGAPRVLRRTSAPRWRLPTAGCHNCVFQKRHMAVLIQSEQVKTSLC